MCSIGYISTWVKKSMGAALCSKVLPKCFNFACMYLTSINELNLFYAYLSV